MAAHPFESLKAEYSTLLAKMRYTRETEITAMARKLMQASYINRYRPVSEKLGVPLAFIATIHMRESDNDFTTNLAQGDPLSRPSTHVPAGRPPLGAPPNDRFPVTWEYAAEDALKLDHVNDTTQPWSMEYACWKGEIYNGFGPRNHGKYTGYLWSGSNIYSGGKYVADGVWDPDANDRQLGIIPVIVKMGELEPSLRIGAPLPVAVNPSPPPIILTPQPVGATLTGTKWIQDSLNKIMAADPVTFKGYEPLGVDGDYGRRTRENVRLYQQIRGLATDGLAGQQTTHAIDVDLTKIASMTTVSVTPKPSDPTWLESIGGGLNKLWQDGKEGQPVIPVGPVKPLPAESEKHDLGSRVMRTMKALQYPWFEDQNIVSIEGMDPNGVPNGNRPNAFDDIKMVLDGNGRIIAGPYEGTTQPGRYWTEHPMASGGAFIIALGYQEIWNPGDYHDLIVWRQAEDSTIMGFRDPNMTFKRIGNPVQHGNIGIHHHGGYNLPRDNISNAAAGCQVIRLTTMQAEFMRITMQCPRYLANKKGYRLGATVLEAKDLLP